MADSGTDLYPHENTRLRSIADRLERPGVEGEMLAVIEELETDNMKCRSALQFLYDVQSGPPLERDERMRWDMAMEDTRKALSHHPRGCSLMFFDPSKVSVTPAAT